MTFYPLEKADRLHANYRQTFRVRGLHLLLLMHQGEPVLVDNICPHAGYPLKDGLIFDGQIRCPMHGYLFDLVEGTCTYSSEGPCKSIRVYDVVRQDDAIGILLPGVPDSSPDSRV